MRRLIIALLLPFLLIPIAVAQTDQRCFPETGQCISGRIREFWEQNGGLPVFGFPTTDQHEEQIEGRSFQVQWFERNRLELHPENARPYDVLLGRLGVDRLAQQGRDWFTFPKGGEQPGCQHFAATGHTVCGAILAYFRSHGLDLSQPGTTEAESLALFGLPISEAATETNGSGATVETQWFERARFEVHPEIGPGVVLLGLLGNEIRAGAAAPPSPPAAPTATPVPIQSPDVLNGYRKRMPKGYWTVSKDGLRISAAGFQYVSKIKYSEAGGGNKFAVFTVEFVNDGYKSRSGDTSILANTATFAVIDLDGQVHDIDSATFSLDNYFDGGTVYQGTKVTGQLAVRIAENSAPAIIVYDFADKRIDLDLRVAPHTQ
jgi:hypothetical protein